MRINFEEAYHDDDLRLRYQGERFTGEVVETTPDGRIIALTSYFNGMEDGPAAEWYPNGQLRARGSTSSGRAVGLHLEWHPNGQLAVEHRFDDAGREISIRRWDESGHLIEDKTRAR
jgi:antitoxin component YwqK of YwqJK toxin-antitoxin module